MTCFVVALPAEARPLIDHYQLEPAGKGEFRTYRRGDRRLVISGVGKVAAAWASAFIQERAQDVWLNVGIAGHRDRAPGELARAHRVADFGTGECYYPTILGLPQIETLGVTTVDVPETRFATEDLFDMEASGFYKFALSSSSTELVQCVKIVSDNLHSGDSGTGSLTGARVTELVRQNLDAIDEIVFHLEGLATGLEPARARPRVEPFLEAWHFTTSEKRRLARVLSRYHALTTPPSAAELGRLKTASAVLHELDERVHALAAEQLEF